MKFFSWLICIVILIASFTPCKDFAGAMVSDTTIGSKAAPADDHSSLANDNCSPFCVCACCSTPTVVSQALPVNVIPVAATVKYADIRPGRILSADPSVWQPPKLG